eukprot:TRINITY_DN65396_c0_g1_i1.p1 TRINITY_DN65396_c0_g1~~TRINITY_DN65396_c0_g1_i1.p1  ORF type:complete len:194 (+),score=32.72 TRINITY_DN65396_c0_g1_i1:80-661(+)
MDLKCLLLAALVCVSSSVDITIHGETYECNKGSIAAGDCCRRKPFSDKEGGVELWYSLQIDCYDGDVYFQKYTALESNSACIGQAISHPPGCSVSEMKTLFSSGLVQCFNSGRGQQGRKTTIQATGASHADPNVCTSTAAAGGGPSLWHTLFLWADWAGVVLACVTIGYLVGGAVSARRAHRAQMDGSGAGGE